MFMRWKMSGLLKESLRNGDEVSFKKLFALRGYEIGIHCVCAERIVLEEVVAGRAPPELLLVFFKELGGRFILAKESCIWSELIYIDAEQQCTVQSMKSVACLMANDLHLPLPSVEMLDQACEKGGWNVLLALGPLLISDFQSQIVERWAPRLFHLHQEDSRLSVADGWFTKVLFPQLSDKGLIQVLRAQKKKRNAECTRRLLNAELQIRKERLWQKQVLLLMPKYRNAPPGLERVFESSLLAQYIIQEVAYKDDMDLFCQEDA